MKSNALSQEDINQRVRETPEWTLHGTSITRDFHFKDFKEAMGFVNDVAEAANSADHHPDISISYSKVKLELSTHSAGGLTAKDFDLAREINNRAKLRQKAA